MKEINSTTDFDQVMSQGRPVLLDFYADWCGPCQALLPVVDELAEKHKDDFTIAKVNVDKNPELSGLFKVRSIPALFFLKDGEVKEKLIGVQSKASLDQKIHSYLA